MTWLRRSLPSPTAIVLFALLLTAAVVWGWVGFRLLPVLIIFVLTGKVADA